ncbi:MAG: hypothetical protein P8I56_02785 [Paracoccaceae bacterium]|jgi:hypothetical protein|nr:hypothetical protein [Paracoccaceae bacterium]
MIEKLPALVNSNAALVRRGWWMNAVMLLGIGDQNWIVAIEGGRIASCVREKLRITAFDFAITGDEDAWRKFWQDRPPPMHHDLHALLRIGAIRLEGDVDMLLANMLYLKIMLETLRGKI